MGFVCIKITLHRALLYIAAKNQTLLITKTNLLMNDLDMTRNVFSLID